MNSPLLIVSYTRMWRHNGGVYVFEPTLREVEMLTQKFEQITWLGALQAGLPPANARPDNTGKIHCLTLPQQGGTGAISKLKLLLALPLFVLKIWGLVRRHSIVHTRGPSVSAAIALVYSLMDKRRSYWHKYAGNWMQAKPPRSYAFQRWMLRKANRSKVTINGHWEGLPPHIIPFENPCFTQKELDNAKQIAAQKTYTGQLELLYVGRLETEKGVGLMMDALSLLPDTILSHIKTIRFVGAGKDEILLIEKAKVLKISYEFTGSLGREALNELYATSHALLLPSQASEGFPKVVAEAAAFGCVPMVSNVSSIGFYVKDGSNGVVFSDYNPETIAKQIAEALMDASQMKNMGNEASKMAGLFTYERYNERVAEILGLVVNW